MFLCVNLALRSTPSDSILRGVCRTSCFLMFLISSLGKINSQFNEGLD